MNDDLKELWKQLGEHEQTLVMMFAKRILMGQRVYGQFDDDKDSTRDFGMEAMEESLDGFVYVARSLQMMRDASA